MFFYEENVLSYYIYSVEMCVYSTNDMFLASYIYSIRQCVYCIRDLFLSLYIYSKVVVVVELLFNVHGKYLRSCRDGQLT